MGGKTKQSQRTKNNVRPSSSSRSAEILNNSLTLDGGLVGAGSGKMLPALFPSLAAVSLDQGLSLEFQICIKKLNKKDPITRTKALAELCELVNNSNVDEVVAALPSWAHFYKTLTADTDRKVREMTQMCHGAIVRVCGRRTAPQLKTLLPPWLQAQYDEHAPAQTNAQNSLKSTFPDTKLPEVISFCKIEVMAHLLDNLLGNTEAIIAKKIENVEEREMQMCRIVTSSLRGLEYFVPALPAAHHDWLWGELTPLLDSNAYWKYASHNAVQVRAAWYGAMGRIIERFKELFAEKYGLKFMRILLNASRETNGLVASQIWTALLQFMHHIQEWYKYLDKKELLVKRIIDVLESGGWGDARHLSSMLLPLLAHLPDDILTKEFYELFFSAVYKGLDKKSIMSSKSERQFWITSLADCLRYLSIQDNNFVVEVVTGVHRTWLEKAFSPLHDEQTRNNLIKCSATNMSSLVKYWLKQSKELNSDKYEQLLRNFWQNIGATIAIQIDKCSANLDEIDRLIEGHILLLQTLRTTFVQDSKKQLSIKFDGDEPSVPIKSTAATEQCDSSIIERYKHNLDDLAHKICSHYFEMAQKTQVSNAILTPLMTVLVEFDSKNLFVALARQFDVNNPYMFYEKVLKSWLAGDTMRCKVIVDIVFQMMKYLSEDEQDAVFDSFKQLNSMSVEWCLSVSMSHAHVGRGGTRRWARSPHAADALATLATRASHRGDGEAAALLLLCLAHTESLFSDMAVLRVVQTVSDAIAHPGDTLEQSGALAARLVTLLAGEPLVTNDPEHFATLVLRLFRLNILIPRGDNRLSVDTWCEIRSSWQDGVAVLPACARDNFLRDAGELLRQYFFQGLTTLNIQNIEHIVSLCPHLFNRSLGDESDIPDEETVLEIIKFTQQLYEMDTKESTDVETFALRHEILTSQLNCLYDDDNDAVRNVVTNSNDNIPDGLSKIDLTVYLNKYLLRAIYLRTMLLHKIALDDDEETEPRTWCDTLLTHKYLQVEFCNILYNYAVLYSLNEGYTHWLHYGIIEESEQKMNALLFDIIGATSHSVRQSILNSLSEQAASKGYYWVYAHRWYIVNAMNGSDGDRDDFDGNRLEDIISGNGFFHMLQASTKWCADRELAYKVSYLVMLRSWNVAHSRLITSEFLRDMARCRPEHDLDVIVNAYYNHQDTMLYDMDISNAPWSQLVSNVAVVEFLALMVERNGWNETAHHWDFTTITLCSLLTSIHKSQHNWGTTRVAMLTRSVLNLYRVVSEFISNIRGESERREPLPHVFDLIKEWKDIFAPDTHDTIYTMIVHVLGTCDSTRITAPQAVVLSSLVSTLPHLSWYSLAPSRSAGELALSALARHAATALRLPAHPAHKYLAYHLLLNLAEGLVFDDSQKLTLWSEENSTEGDEEKAPPEFLFDYFQDTFTHLHEIVDAALNNVVLGEEICELVPLSDSHSMTLGWLLLADALAAMCKLARGDLEQFYIQIYRERKYAPALLSCSLRLLPSEVFAYADDSSGTAPLPTQYSDAFLQVNAFTMYDASKGSDVSLLACRCVLSAVCGAGCGSARGWWGAAVPRVSRQLERVVTAYVAPHAIKEQLNNLHNRAAEIDDTEIRIAWSSYEVVCLLAVEECHVELRAWLSRAHPLVPPRLAVPDTAGPGGNTQWLALYLAYQNGTLLNALKMWTQAVNARVERSPQCYICYCRLHAATGRLPRVPCHQCKSRFHNQCLRKWFLTSNKSNCPLCRTAF